MRTCSVDTCERLHHAKGLCSGHYNRLKRYGDPLGRYEGPSLADRFWSKVDKSGECWIWTGTKDQKGYGQIKTTGRVRERAHRVSWEMVNGPIGDGQVVDHLCYTTSCVRPDHLRLASARQNNENRKGNPANNTSGFRGVYWHPKAGKWMGMVGHKGKSTYVGLFPSKEECAEAVRKKRIELHEYNEIDRST